MGLLFLRWFSGCVVRQKSQNHSASSIVLDVVFFIAFFELFLLLGSWNCVLMRKIAETLCMYFSWVGAKII